MRWCRTNATCRKSSGIRVWVSPTSRTICAVCWNAGWSVAAAKAASFGIVWRTGGSPISSVMQISYLPRQPTELMPAKAIRTNRRDLLQCPIGAPNLKQPSAHPQRMHPLSALPTSACLPVQRGALNERFGEAALRRWCSWRTEAMGRERLGRSVSSDRNIACICGPTHRSMGRSARAGDRR